MSANKRYFWLKLKEDFFGQKEIKQLRKIAGGDTYTVIYLKLLLSCLKNDGKIYYDGVSDTFIEEIALDIDEDVENVKITVSYLERKGIATWVNETEIHLSAIHDMVGSETKSAEKMRRHRNTKQLEFIENKTTIGHNVTQV